MKTCKGCKHFRRLNESNNVQSMQAFVCHYLLDTGKSRSGILGLNNIGDKPGQRCKLYDKATDEERLQMSRTKWDKGGFC